MNKLFWLLMPLMFLQAYADQLVWQSASSTDMNAAANYYDLNTSATAVAVGTADTLLFDSTQTNGKNTAATMTAALSVGKITIQKYKGNWSTGTYKLTLNNDMATGVDYLSRTGTTTAGTFTIGDTIDFKGTGGAWYVHTGGGDITMTSTKVIIEKNMNLTPVGMGVITFFSGAFPGYYDTITQTAAISLKTPLLLNGGTLVNNSTYGFNLAYTNTAMSGINQNGTVILGSGGLQLYSTAAGIKDTFGYYKGTQSNGITLRGHYANDTIVQGDSVIQTGPLLLYSSSTTTGSLTYYTMGKYFGCTGALTFENDYSTAFLRAYLGSSFCDWGSVGFSGYPLNIYLNSASITCRGNWINLANDTITPGTSSTVTFSNTAKATIASVNQLFYDIIESPTANKIDSTADSLNCNTFSSTAGVDKFGGHNRRIRGAICSFAGDSTLCRSSSTNLSMASGGTLTMNSTVIQVDSMNVLWGATGSIAMNKNVSIRDLKLPTADAKLTLQALKQLTVLKYTAGNLSGTSTHPDTLKSSAAGSRAQIYFGLQPNSNYLCGEDIAAQNLKMIDTTYPAPWINYNLGNDSNWQFTDSMHQYYTVMGNGTTHTLTSITPARADRNGGTTVTFNGTGCYYPVHNYYVGGLQKTITPVDSNSYTLVVIPGTRGSTGYKSYLDSTVDGKTATCTNCLYLFATPTLDSIRPYRVSPAGGTTITYKGTGMFNDGHGAGLLRAWVDGTAVTGISSVDSNTFIAVTPAHASGLVRDSLYNSDSGLVVTANALEYLPQYTLTTVNSTPAGTLSPTAGAHTVDSAASTALSYTAPANYAFWKWTRSATTATIGDSTHASTTVALSASATITAACTSVVVGPTITVQPFALTVNDFATGNDSVTATGTGTLTYAWYKWYSAAWHAITGAVARILSYTGAYTDNGDSLYVAVTDNNGTTNSDHVLLTVNPVAPVITTQPKLATGRTGQTATFTVLYYGTIPISNKWKKSHVTIVGATYNSYTTPALDSTYNNVYYYDSIYNIAGYARTDSVKLTVGKGAADWFFFFKHRPH